MVGAPVRRIQVAYARSRGLSQRRACALLSTSRSSLHYESWLEARDKPLMAAMSGLAATYPRFGYRRINVFMDRLGHVMGADKAFRLWCKRTVVAANNQWATFRNNPPDVLLPKPLSEFVCVLFK